MQKYMRLISMACLVLFMGLTIATVIVDDSWAQRRGGRGGNPPAPQPPSGGTDACAQAPSGNGRCNIGSTTLNDVTCSQCQTACREEKARNSNIRKCDWTYHQTLTSCEEEDLSGDYSDDDLDVYVDTESDSCDADPGTLPDTGGNPDPGNNGDPNYNPFYPGNGGGGGGYLSPECDPTDPRYNPYSCSYM